MPQSPMPQARKQSVTQPSLVKRLLLQGCGFGCGCGSIDLGVRRKPASRWLACGLLSALLLGSTAMTGCGKEDKQAENEPDQDEIDANDLRVESQKALRVGDVKQAGKLLDQALKLKPNNLRLLLDRADLHALQGQYADAALMYSRAEQFAKQHEEDMPEGVPEAALGSAMVHQAMGEQAIFEAKLARAKKGFLTRLKLLNDAADEIRQKRAKNQRIEPEEVDLALTDDQIATRATLAYITALSGDPDTGLIEAQKLLKEAPGNAVIERTIMAIQENYTGKSLPRDLARPW